MTRATGLNLRLYELKMITQALERLERSGLRVDHIVVGSYKIHVRYVPEDRASASYQDTGYWIIEGIERASGR